MQISAALAGRFDELTRTIRHFWSVQDAVLERSEQVVLVDLQHNDLNCLIGCLTGAKYLSQLTGAGLVGVIGQNATQRHEGRPEDYDAEPIRRLAEAFGVTVLLPADGASLAGFVADRPHAAEAVRADLARFDTCWDGGGDAPDWSRIADFRTSDGCDVGRGIADSAAKVLGDPRPGAGARDLVRALAVEALQVRQVASWVCDTAEVVGYVTSHICYASWSTLATTVSEHGGTVVLAESLPNGTAFNLIAPGSPRDSRIGDRRAAGMAELFAAVAARRGPALDGLLAKTAVLMGSPLGPAAGWWAVDQATTVERGSSSPLRRQALQKLGVADLDRPVAFVLSHCLTDAARQETCAYDDYYAWLRATLLLARDVPDRTWVVRLHPWYRMFRETATVSALKAEFADVDHIRFDDGTLSKDEYFSACDLAVTVRGTAAWELGRFGVPVVVAGRSWYEHAGFVHAPDGAAAYEELLRRPIDEVLAVARRPDGREAALAFALFTMLLLPLSSPLLPPRDDHPFAALITSLTQRYRSTVLELDPAFRAMGRAWAEQRGGTLNEDLVALLDRSAATAAAGQAPLQRSLEQWAEVGRAA